MLKNLEIFTVAQGLARHSAARQSVIAQNVANADTPGYRARDIAEFSSVFRSDGGSGLRATRPQHGFGNEGPVQFSEQATIFRPGEADPNGNNVSIEKEIFASAQAKGAHDRALAVYGSAMKIMRTAISGRG